MTTNSNRLNFLQELRSLGVSHYEESSEGFSVRFQGHEDTLSAQPEPVKPRAEQEERLWRDATESELFGSPVGEE